MGAKFCPTPMSIDFNSLEKDIKEGCRKVRLKELHFDSERSPKEPPKFYKPTGYEPPSGRDRTLDVYCDTLESKVEEFKKTKT